MVSGSIRDIGAGRDINLGDVSISVSLDDSAVWRSVMCLVCTMLAVLGLKRLQKGLKKIDFNISDVLRYVNLIWTILLLYVFFLLFFVCVCEMYGSIKFSNIFSLYMRI